MEIQEPRITLKRDVIHSVSGSDRDLQVTFDKLPSELGKRMAKVGKEPIFVQYESKSHTNMTFIDTPGIPDEGSADYDKILKIVTQLAKPMNRILICVEEASEWSKLRMPKIIKTVDPDLSRTIFAHTKFNTQIQLLGTLSLVNKYLSGVIPDTKTFFVSLPSLKVRRKQTTDETYQEKVWQAYKRDMNHLEQLQYDKRFERNVGIHSLRKFLLNKIWRSYQDRVPEILKCIRAKKTETEATLKSLKAQSDELNTSKLREIANGYCMDFLQGIDKLIAGTSEGLPLINGQTLEEEKYSQGDFEWVDSYNHTILFDAEKWNIPYWKSKVYGGQQFERLLAEFKAVCDRAEISDVSLDEIATSAGVNKVNNVPNYAWAAADLAQSQTKESFVPLIEQLQKRAVYVVKRLYDIADRLLAAKGESSSKQLDVENVHHYPYFTNFVKNLFYKFIDEKAAYCKERCMDEFYSSKTIFWELTEFSDRKLSLTIPDKNADEAKAAVSKLATDLFHSIRDRITKNVMLKFYNFFLVPIQTELWNEIQKKVTTIQTEELEQYFQVNLIKEKLQKEEKELEETLGSTAEQERQFIDAAKQLTHPNAIITSGTSTKTPRGSIAKK